MKHNGLTMNRTFIALYTKQKTQKAKKWHDGTFKFNESNRKVCFTLIKKKKDFFFNTLNFYNQKNQSNNFETTNFKYHFKF